MLSPSSTSFHATAEILWQQVMALGMPSLAGFSVEIVPEIDSTNSELMRRAREGRFEPTLLIAEHQHAGRGRMGRTWQSTRSSSLTFSLGLPMAPSSWEGMSLAVGVSLANSLDKDRLSNGAVHPSPIQIKWPNDLWLDRRKLAGILIETTGMPGNTQRFAVIGIGINISDSPALQSEMASNPLTASLDEIQPAISPKSALEQLFTRLLADLLEFERTGLQGFLSRFNARDALKGLAVQMSHGLAGTAQGIDSQGALLVHTSQGLQRVSSDEVSVRPQT